MARVETFIPIQVSSLAVTHLTANDDDDDVVSFNKLVI